MLGTSTITSDSIIWNINTEELIKFSRGGLGGHFIYSHIVISILTFSFLKQRISFFFQACFSKFLLKFLLSLGASKVN